MNLKKKHLETTLLLLKGTDGKLSLKEARLRDQFMREIASSYDQFIKDKKTILDTLCDKDAEGKPDIKDGNYHFAPELHEQLQSELNTLLEEEVEIKEVKGIKKILENTDYKPKIGESDSIDEILSQL